MSETINSFLTHCLDNLKASGMSLITTK